MGKPINLVGMGDDGCLGLSARAHQAIVKAQVLVGGARSLEFFPDFKGTTLVLKDGIVKVLERAIELSYENDVTVLASGDPLFYGIGKLLLKKAGAEHVEVIPQPSAMQWAFAKAGLSWDDADIISLHGRPIEGLITKVRDSLKVGLFTDGENSPPRIAQRLLEYGLTDFNCHVCEHLCGPGERVRQFSVEDLAKAGEIDPLNVLILERPEAKPSPVFGLIAEEDYARRMPKKGLITKKEVRALSLAALNLTPTSVVWDVGAGSGSVSIEAALVARKGWVYGIECDPVGVEIMEENLRRFAVDNVRIVPHRAPQALEGLEAPDAVFVGGSKGELREIMALSFDALKPGGRLVVNAVTLESVTEARLGFQDIGLLPELSLIQVSRGSPLAGKYLRYDALNPIHMFYGTKPREEA